MLEDPESIFFFFLSKGKEVIKKKMGVQNQGLEEETLSPMHVSFPWGWVTFALLRFLKAQN